MFYRFREKDEAKEIKEKAEGQLQDINISNYCSLVITFIKEVDKKRKKKLLTWKDHAFGWLF